MIKYIGFGRTRIAFKVFSFAVKIAWNFKGIRACREEVEIWKKENHPCLAPVLWSFPGVVVMPYYPTEFYGEKPLSFIKTLNSIGITDLHPYNIRMHDGKPMAIDYAINAGSHGQGEPTGGWKCDQHTANNYIWTH